MTDSTNPKENQPTLYTPSEVAQFFRVDPNTVTRWARTGTLNPITLPSGHRRYHATEIHELLEIGNAREPAAPLQEAEFVPGLRALAVLQSVVRDYFDGDPSAVVKALTNP
ncbi:Helix-turn-helix domain protein [Actinomadura rubteroloni]|uniref:Helix-turn-helix domain protein n=1 Tax=Actinomadura rubteroloni TaxID=1926885 RepID=A0A2P4UIF5_9ACTN|nr:helix-turn-helix domain-containing protein [Actinomadura rubteroloni]POM24816.1 Helix-turn-helix domain protein [Actinomadura rubteroloni]